MLLDGPRRRKNAHVRATPGDKILMRNALHAEASVSVVGMMSHQLQQHQRWPRLTVSGLSKEHLLFKRGSVVP
eukprot:613236-Pyramimonas_sp.AAC.1